MTCLVICEKPSAAANFAAALGGMEGEHAGERYKIVALRGHLLELVSPENQVPPRLSQRYRKWTMDALPWSVSDLAFKRDVTASGRDAFNNAAKAIKTLMSKDEAVIATDLDPSGEGELIAWEVLDACGFDSSRVKVSRMLFQDEAPASIRRAFENRVAIASKNEDGDYLKAEARSRWDFCSMQLTRVATLLARERGHKGVVCVGRLKSVMVSEVGRQLDACAAYKRAPFFEVRFKDSAGRVFKRDADAAERFAAASEVDLSGYGESAVVLDGRSAKSEKPGRLLDLAALSAILAKRGSKPKEVLETYQGMYEAHIVSYPRTEDKTITSAQFDEFLAVADKVASVVGIDASLLTHRAPRKSHVRDGGAHGANRPGPVVPERLSDLERFGKSACAIYELLARSCLSMLAEDYAYDACSAHLEAYPEYKASWRECTEAGYREVVGAAGAEDDEGRGASGLDDACGTASPFVFEGSNARPEAPTLAWLMKRLEAYEVGTGATRTSTFAEVTERPSALMSDSKGRLGLTDIGRVAYTLLDGTRISDAEETERLFSDMERVGRFEMTADELVGGITELVEHDKGVMVANASSLPMGEGAIPVGKCPLCGDDVVKRGAVFTCASNKSRRGDDGAWEDVEGCGFRIYERWCGKKLTDKQAASLLSGGRVALKGCKSKAGKTFDCVLKLANGGIEPIFGDEGNVGTASRSKS